MRSLFAGCVLVAALSLFLPSVPSYDPWAWLVWGRELSEGQLNTFAGPSWKPLPPLITAVYNQLAGANAAVWLWLLTARAAGLLTLVLAGRLGARLAGGGRGGVAAGVLASVALLLSPEYVRYLAHGNEVPLAAAFVLGAVLRHLDGRSDHALVLGGLAVLLRPEGFPFLAVYAVVVWRSQPERRSLMAAIGALLPALWIVPEWWGSGDPLGGGRQAGSAPSWTLATREQPWLAALERAHRMAGPPLEVGSVAALVAGLTQGRRPLVVLATAALTWTALVCAMTELGFSGNPRYFSLALVLTFVLAGAGAVELVRWARGPLLAAATTAALMAIAAPTVSERLARLGGEVRDGRALAVMHSELVSSVGWAGGPSRLAALGPVTANRPFQTHLAWALGVPIAHVERAPGPAIVLRARGALSGPSARPKWWRAGRLEPLAQIGHWSILATPAARTHIRPSFRQAPPAHGSRARLRPGAARGPGSRRRPGALRPLSAGGRCPARPGGISRPRGCRRRPARRAGGHSHRGGGAG